MAMENGCNSNEVFRERAKELLTSKEFERLKIAVKNFSKTRSVETLCSNLFKIVDSPAKVDILAEVRRCLPEKQRNKFTRYCNELLKTEAVRERRDLEKRQKVGQAKEFKRGRDLENCAPNFQGSPAKKTKQNNAENLGSKAGKKASQRSKKSAPDCAKDGATSKTQVGKFDAPSKSATKIILLERNNMKQGFGFRIRGVNSREPSITVAEVAKGSLADRKGLKRQDQIIRVNDKLCGKGCVNIAELIRIIKAAKVLHMRIIPAEVVCKDGSKVEDVSEANGKERSKQEGKSLYAVVVYPGEDGWLGCCIRGGTDYACDVHVISVDTGSPAERAGVKAGDAIVRINGTNTEGLTHVQVVRLVVTSGSCVRFSLKPSGKQRRSSRQRTADIRPTPLRTQHTRSHDVTPPQSPSFRHFHLPGYPHQHRRLVADSPSQLPLDVMTLDCLPPPPYTPEVPSRHRVLARGHEGQGTPSRQPQDTKEPWGAHCRQEPQDSHYSQDLQGTISQQEPQDTTVRQEPQDIQLIQEPQPQETTFSEGSQETPCQQEPQGTPCLQEPQGTPCQDVAMEMIDNGEGKMVSLDEESLVKETLDKSLPSCTSQSPTEGNGRESFLSQIKLKRLSDCPQSNTPGKLHSAPSVDSHTPEKTQLTTGDCCLPSSTNLSPPQENGRESFLSQIRQFNNAKLRKLSEFPKQTTPDQHQSNPSEVLLSTEGGKDTLQVYNDAHRSIEANSLFTALTRVMRNRARVLHDTLSSADECDSDSSSDDDEWEL